MDITNLIWIGILAAVFITIVLLIRGWITIYNKFVYWRTKAERKFADIDVITQQRIDMIHALAQVAKKYSIHEWKTLKETIEARSRWTKDTPLSEKVRNTQEIENNFIKIQAVFEKYPEIKADSLYKSIMGHGNISRIESRLRIARLEYNRTVQQYNERLMRFPRKIVARVHGFEKLNYLDFTGQEPYRPKEIFND
jgi:LemA protein